MDARVGMQTIPIRHYKAAMTKNKGVRRLLMRHVIVAAGFLGVYVRSW